AGRGARRSFLLSPLLRILYQGALRLTHAKDSQPGEIMIRCGRHMEACNGGNDWGSDRLHIIGFAGICPTMQ
ncbi:hypothetical protein, partial [Blastomonas sp. AAP25]|uniref:hypothetical protein n=1 Tax=Blastomonas sp. AAP25 TaxID=1523416 RepID=UPI001E56D495